MTLTKHTVFDFSCVNDLLFIFLSFLVQWRLPTRLLNFSLHALCSIGHCISCKFPSFRILWGPVMPPFLSTCKSAGSIVVRKYWKRHVIEPDSSYQQLQNCHRTRRLGCIAGVKALLVTDRLMQTRTYGFYGGACIAVMVCRRGGFWVVEMAKKEALCLKSMKRGVFWGNTDYPFDFCPFMFDFCA